jgi:NAD(P)-dependent dehydrogenase (short-subunit alcohol dehydrogenase family)
MYHASKWALEGLSQSLAAEVAEFGIKVTLIEPTGYSTDWGGASAQHAAALPAYAAAHTRAEERRGAVAGRRGNPEATRAAVLAIVDSSNPPLRIFFGDGPLAIAEQDYEDRLATWHEWEPLSVAAHGITG